MYDVAYAHGVAQEVTAVPYEVAIAEWNRDIERHTTLRREYAFVASIQSDLMGKIRRLKDLNAGKSPNTGAQETKDELLPAPLAKDLPSSTRARIALRQAFTKLDAPANTQATPLQKLERELAYLDKRQTARRDQMAEIEGRVLTIEPQSADQANTILRFVSEVLAFGHKIDTTYLADVLDACAEAKPVYRDPELRIAI